MKSLFVNTATFAVAISLASAAQANEAPRVSSPAAVTDISIAPEGAHPSAQADAAAISDAKQSVIIAEAFEPIEIALLEEFGPVEIDAPVQKAIYDVEFAGGEASGFVMAPAPSTGATAFERAGLAHKGAEVTSYALSPDAGRFEIDPVVQDAIFNVDFTQDLQGALVSIGGELPLSIVSPRGLSNRSLDPYYGDIDAFYGDIVAFYGDIDAFWGDINPFYGDINPFYGNINPFYGDINPFYGDIDAFWGDIDAFNGSDLSKHGDFWKAQTESISIVNFYWDRSHSWGTNYFFQHRLIDEAVDQYGSRGFTQERAQEVLRRHGITLNSPSIFNLTQGQRAAFFLDWHDTINTYSGIDAVDHWMGAINWTPGITQIQGSGRATVIGIIDGSFSSDSDLGNNIIWSGGGHNSVGGHGAGVASLIAGAHDGSGVMGIAPDVNIATYNPFDANGNGSWTDVANGFVALRRMPASYGQANIINLSLGEAGWVFSDGTADFLYRWDVDNYYNDTLFVFAAGNEGISQNVNVEFNDADETAMIFVGSVDLAGEISSFSNRPGSACLTDFGRCFENNRLYMRTVVAPGELLLVSDGQGGVVRQSGTSFAAPLVSGAVALLHERWPWLADSPHETAEIIFRSARDLGTPGPDEVYGWGLLDVEASQSPLDFGQLEVFMFERSRGYNARAMSLTQLLNSGIPSWWETEDVYFTAYETIGDTWRDFSIPMSSGTAGTTNWGLGKYLRMQDFISDRFANWLLSKGADKNGNGRAGISQIRSNLVETSGQWTVGYEAIAPNFGQDGAVIPVHNAATLTDPKGTMSFTFGHGQGAMALSGNNLGIISDHSTEIGGVNPVLGFASGELFAGATYNVAAATTLTFGYSENREDWEDLRGASELDRQLQRQFGAREANALTFGVEQQVTDSFAVDVQYTRLQEQDAVLGVQTAVDDFLGQGAMTEAVTVTMSMDMGDGLSFDLSATGGSTASADENLFTSSGRTISSAGQFTVNKVGVMNTRDILRVSVGQPLTIERGELEFTSEQVVNRLTGERGQVTQTIGIETKRRVTGEIVYATPVTPNAELGLIGRYVSEGEIGQEESFMVGANFGLRF